MHSIPHGYVKAVVTYQCKWCKREEVITLGGDLEPLDGWKTYDLSWGPGLDLCSSDCEKERDEAFNKAYANLEPMPGHSHQHPAGLKAEVERLRIICMKERGLC